MKWVIYLKDFSLLFFRNFTIGLTVAETGECSFLTSTMKSEHSKIVVPVFFNPSSAVYY